jgi:hypothetical protein
MMMKVKLRETYRELRRRGLKGPSHVGALLRRSQLSWSIIHHAVGVGYGVPTSAARQAKVRAAGVGLEVETTYTGKCLAGMFEDLAELEHAEDVLWWNTHAGRKLNEFIAPDWRDALDFDLPTPSTF